MCSVYHHAYVLCISMHIFIYIFIIPYVYVVGTYPRRVCPILRDNGGWWRWYN